MRFMQGMVVSFIPRKTGSILRQWIGMNLYQEKQMKKLSVNSMNMRKLMLSFLVNIFN